MTDVKRMTAKPDFLKMSLKDQKCEVKEYEDCRTVSLAEGQRSRIVNVKNIVQQGEKGF